MSSRSRSRHRRGWMCASSCWGNVAKRGDVMRYNRISADCHLDLIWLPPDLFTSEAPQALKDRMPYVADGPDGERWWVAKNGVKFGIAGGVGASGTKYVPGKQLRVDVMASTRLYEDGKQGIRRPVAEHAARHIEVRMEIVEASQAPERRSQDQERPAVADQLEASREIAVAQRYRRAAPERGVGLGVSHGRRWSELQRWT